ncbi:MAG: PadR family transcriptional regulator [Spirochaetaceae bacterium]|nr:PadR family transcriptional regulator [Spirochaetaceae bacterium]
MSIRSAILGYLEWRPATGYELKKLFAEAAPFHWSGNNNQVYGALLELHRDGAVGLEVVPQDKRPARKVYTITDPGRAELSAWLREEAGLPEIRADFHARLAWSAALPPPELEALISAYEERLAGAALILRERERRGGDRPARSSRERLIWTALAENRLAAMEHELAWARRLRAGLRGL